MPLHFDSDLRFRFDLRCNLSAWFALIVFLNRTTPTRARAPNTARCAENLGIGRNEQVANSVCASTPHQDTQHPNGTPCSECGATTHKSALSVVCPSPNKCTDCQGTLEPKGHNRNDCPRMQGCSECGSISHKSALSFACPEHKCSNCEGTLEPKGHNRNDCPRMQTTMSEECGETGHRRHALCFATTSLQLANNNDRVPRQFSP